MTAARLVVDRAGEVEPSGWVVADGGDTCGREGSGIFHVVASLAEPWGSETASARVESAQYLMDTYGITAEQAGDGSPDVVADARRPTDRAAALERALSAS